MPKHFPDDPLATCVERIPATFPTFPKALKLNALENYWAALQLTPVSSVEWRCTPAWTVGPRIVPDSMFFHIHAGRGRGFVEDQHFDLQPGDFMLIPKGCSHGAVQEKGHPFHLTATHFHAHVFGGANLLDLLGFPVHVRTHPQRDAEIVRMVRENDREYGAREPGYRQSVAANITRILLYIVREHGERFKPPYASDRSQELRRLLPAFDCLERNLTDGLISIGDLARTVHVSEVQFRKLFRRVTGFSPARYIQSRRIERACRMLRDSNASVEEAALAAGFADSAFFCRVFKTWTKTTPTEYRKSVL